VASPLGLVGEHGPRRGLAPCPSCGESQRGRRDRRGPIGLTRDGAGWACHRCDAKGDALDLAAWQLCRGRLATLTAAERTEVREWLVEHGFLPAAPGADPARPWRSCGPSCLPQAANTDREHRASVAGVEDLRDRALPAADDPEAVPWLRSRKLDPGRVDDLDLARVLPRDCALPRWARACSRTWTESGHRLLLPLWDEAGRLVSLHARSVRQGDGPKSVSPAGHAVLGLVLADPTALHLLRHGSPPSWGRDAAGEVIVTEGVPDFLTWATHWGEAAESPPAVLGVIGPGSWPADAPVAAALPDGCLVSIATHTDEAGERYAEAIRTSVGARCRVRRLVP